MDLLTSISIFISISGAILTGFWKISTFTKQVELKVDKDIFNKTEEALARLEQRFEYLEKELKEKADIAELTLLKQNMEYIKQQMVTKTDWYQLKEEIIKALKQ